MSMTITPRLTVNHLSTRFPTEDGLVRSVADVSFSILPGKTTALVGESGSGKSVTSLTLMRLLPKTANAQVDGQTAFVTREGKTVDLLALGEREMRSLRGNQLSMIFQEPMTSLNPVFRIGEQIAESVRLHKGLDRQAALAHALRMLDLVEIPAAAQRLDEYPHQLSGGMRQRVMIAMALACRPALLIADEPTTALDVTIQAQILDLLQELQAETGMAIILITHDLGVVAQIADEVAVMYAGRIVERAPVAEIFSDAQHPYTIGLMGSMPRMEEDVARLVAIDGMVPPLFRLPQGCRFNPRCPFAEAVCSSTVPPLGDTLNSPASTHLAACHMNHAGSGHSKAPAADLVDA